MRDAATFFRSPKTTANQFRGTLYLGSGDIIAIYPEFFGLYITIDDAIRSIGDSEAHIEQPDRQRQRGA